MFDIKAEVLRAEERIRPLIRQTLLDYSFSLSQQVSAQVYLKCENLQYTNSFKLRGALNKLLTLTEAERAKGVVTASTGNHATAVAYGLHQFNIPGVIFVPETVSPAKVANIQRYGANLQYYATDPLQTELFARAYAEKHGMTYISPYNDPKIIGGQGTIGLELAQQLSDIDAILVPVGGGGLIAGIAGYIKAVSPKTKIIGCSPMNSALMAASLQAGHIVDGPEQKTLSDGTAGGIESGSITFPICQNLIDDFILVSETEIQAAMIEIIQSQHLLVEGAGAVTVAALLQQQQRWKNQTVVAILCGGNISVETLRQVLR